MELVISFKSSDSTQSNFTYTTSECRLKLCEKDANPINTAMIKFCESIVEYLEDVKYPLSLRGSVVERGNSFFIKLQQSKRHIDIDKFMITCDKENIFIKEL
jgi:hypothetical protein